MDVWIFVDVGVGVMGNVEAGLGFKDGDAQQFGRSSVQGRGVGLGEIRMSGAQQQERPSSGYNSSTGKRGSVDDLISFSFQEEAQPSTGQQGNMFGLNDIDFAQQAQVPPHAGSLSDQGRLLLRESLSDK